MKQYAIKHDASIATANEAISAEIARRISGASPDVCPIAQLVVFTRTCAEQSCGKCVPCRNGLVQLLDMLESVLAGEGADNAFDTIAKLAEHIGMTSACAIGIQAGKTVAALLTDQIVQADFTSHSQGNGCSVVSRVAVPCQNRCPAGVNVPGYIALGAQERFDDAVQLIRQDNPFPAVCGLICEHPCEDRCRRKLVDDAVNIRALKHYYSENSIKSFDTNQRHPAEQVQTRTNKKVAVIGGGPSGLTAAYYLQLMGHMVTIFERRDKLGGMLRYGIPSYRLPRTILDADIAHILALGAEVKFNTSLGNEPGDVTLDQLHSEYDAVYLSIGAHASKSLRLPGENLVGVYNAVEILRLMDEITQDGVAPNNLVATDVISDGSELLTEFAGKDIVVIGGGNVAMDVCRTAIRLGAASVSCVYRRRQSDMTAMPIEIAGALAEGLELLTLYAPIEIKASRTGAVDSVVLQRQMVGELDSNGRPRPVAIEHDTMTIKADIVISAVGQEIEQDHLVNAGEIASESKFVVAGGDYISGPATVILAIAAGKKGARLIDQELGFKHNIKFDIEIAKPKKMPIVPCGRANPSDRPAHVRKVDFALVELPLTAAEAEQEASRCLRCDYFGYGQLDVSRAHTHTTGSTEQINSSQDRGI